MASKFFKDYDKNTKRIKRRRNPKDNLRKSNYVNDNLIPLQVIQNKANLENIMKDYVVEEEEQPLSEKKFSQKKLKKLEKVKARKERSFATKSSDTEERTIFVGNVNIQSNRDELKKFFRKYGEIEAVRFRGITPESADMSKKEAVAKKLLHPHRKSFYAYVRFKEKSSVEKALEANGEIFKDYHIHVDRAIPSINHKDKNCVFVGNLPWEINEEDLWQFFGSCGKVTNVRVVRSSSTGAGKGFAFVTFESNDGVQLALHLNGKEFMKREIRVKKLAKKVKVKEQTKSSLKPVKRKAGANFSSKSKKVSKPMDVSFLKDDKPKLFNDKIKEKGKKENEMIKAEKS
ncbi:UNVERIFIED_CONTAM: hypothetical protein RMT77_004631 [Armadillidium vulgare]